MQDLNSIKSSVAEMARVALAMWQTTHKAFMEHDLDLIEVALKDENKLNAMEKQITQRLVELSSYACSKKEKSDITVYTEAVGDLELIGDYCKDILERVHIKIDEKLLFSDDAVEDYSVLYAKAEDVLKDVVLALEKGCTGGLEKDKNNIDKIVDSCRKKHDQRLIAGVFSPLACNMFLNMLDFTAAVYSHARKVLRNLHNLGGPVQGNC